jgi:hypothetical protein
VAAGAGGGDQGAAGCGERYLAGVYRLAGAWPLAGGTATPAAARAMARASTRLSAQFVRTDPGRM